MGKPTPDNIGIGIGIGMPLEKLTRSDHAILFNVNILDAVSSRFIEFKNNFLNKNILFDVTP
jgi:hypothetical protein